MKKSKILKPCNIVSSQKTLESLKKALEEGVFKSEITLESLLKDNCKLAKELWGEEIISITNPLFGNGFKIEAFKHHLNQIAQLISQNDDIQEYINKTKI